MNPEIEELAQQRLAAAEAEQSKQRKQKVTLGSAFREFWRHPTPWLITASGATA